MSDQESRKKAVRRYYEKTTRISGSINPEKEPDVFAAFQALVEKHGGKENKGAIASAIREAILSTSSSVLVNSDTPVYDLSNSTVVGIRLPSAILHDIVQSAGQNEITVEQEILNRLGFTLETHKTIL